MAVGVAVWVAVAVGVDEGLGVGVMVGVAVDVERSKDEKGAYLDKPEDLLEAGVLIYFDGLSG